MMAVIQIAFFSLISLSELNPCFAALSSLNFVNGYNSLNKNHLEDSLTPIPPKGIFLFSRFMDNFNFTIGIILIPLLFALITFILSKTVCRDSERLAKMAKRAVGEYTLMAILLCGYIVAVSLALEVIYGVKKMDDLVGVISLVECAFLLALFIIYFVFILCKPDPEYFGEFVGVFNKDSFWRKYCGVMILERLVVGACLVILVQTKFGAAILIGIFLALGLLVIFMPIHKENWQRGRVIANFIIIISIEAIYLAYNLTGPTQRQNSNIFFYLPFIVCALLFICVVYSAVSIIYSICRSFKKNDKQIPTLQEENQEFAKLRYESTRGLSVVPRRPETVIPSNIRQSALLNLSQTKKNFAKLKKSEQDQNKTGIIDETVLKKSEVMIAKLAEDYDAL